MLVLKLIHVARKIIKTQCGSHRMICAAWDACTTIGQKNQGEFSPEGFTRVLRGITDSTTSEDQN